MTERDFYEKILDLSSDGSRVLVYVADQVLSVQKIMAYHAGLELDAVKKLAEHKRALYNTVLVLKGREIIISDNFDLKEKEKYHLKPDYVLDERDYQPFEAEKTTPRESVGER